MISTEETRERAKTIHDYLVAHPEEHNQRQYGKQTSCGTTMCIAGTALIFFRPDLVEWDDLGPVKVLKGWSLGVGRGEDIDEVAGELLGLEYSETQDLFYDMSNQSALDKLAKVAAGEKFENTSCQCELCV